MTATGRFTVEDLALVATGAIRRVSGLKHLSIARAATEAILGVLVGCHVCRCPGCKGTGSVDGVPVGRVCGRCEGSGIWIERLV